MVDFYEQQAKNRHRTAILLGGFLLTFAILGIGIDIFYLESFTLKGEGFPLASVIALVAALVMGLASYWGGDKMVLASLRAQPLDPNILEHRELRNIVTEMALASGLPMPKVYRIPDPAPNALSTGRNAAHASIAVTDGLLVLLDREETQGVIAHEMAHIKNQDILVMTVAGVLLGGMVLLADWARRSLYFARQGGRSKGRRGVNLFFLVIVLLLVALAPLLSRLLAMAISRQREYLADATAAEFTRNPLGLAQALEKIGGASFPLRQASKGTAHFFITNPLKRRIDEREGKLGDFLSTHPPLSRRIAILKAMAHAG